MGHEGHGALDEDSGELMETWTLKRAHIYRTVLRCFNPENHDMKLHIMSFNDTAMFYVSQNCKQNLYYKHFATVCSSQTLALTGCYRGVISYRP
jgi:hypothetical protein